MWKSRDIDSKFAVSKDGKIYKKSNEEIIPDDEPLFLIRGRDLLGIPFLKLYEILSEVAGCNDYHFSKFGESRDGFVNFKEHHPKRMKMPSITEGK
jgi:hypothetical protein